MYKVIAGRTILKDGIEMFNLSGSLNTKKYSHCQIDCMAHFLVGLLNLSEKNSMIVDFETYFKEYMKK